jgi:hypothetical protein
MTSGSNPGAPDLPPSGRDRYFRDIAARFIALRGAPFSLSPADLSLIASWESAGIPLAVVLEGVENSFALRPGRPHVAGKIRTLSFCRTSVERAFGGFRERGVGGTRPSGEAKAARKRAAARAAVEAFLARPPEALAGLVPDFEAALVHLASERPEAEALERLDERLEDALRSLAAPEDRRSEENGIRRHHPDLRGRAKSEAVEVALGKRMRGKYRVPYVSLFYY